MLSYYSSQGSSQGSGLPDLVPNKGSTVSPLPPPPPTAPKLKSRHIIKDMCDNSNVAFSGFGRHTANDILYELALFPGTPCHVICRDGEVYEAFKAYLHHYMMKFEAKAFLAKLSSVTNSDNPFSFNETSNRNFLASAVKVFRRVKVSVPTELYNTYQLLGLLDPDHTIGQFMLSWSLKGEADFFVK
jgi:hypothetical protein